MMAIDVAEVHGHVVDMALLLDHLGHVDAFGEAEAADYILVGANPHADDEVRAHGAAHRLQQVEREAHPVLETAAVFVVPQIGGRRLELFR